MYKRASVPWERYRYCLSREGFAKIEGGLGTAGEGATRISDLF